jgi:hypothetical protein
MAKRKFKEYFGQCSYHWGQSMFGLRAVQLTHDGKEWQHAIAVCSSCRNHLKGHFRYAKNIFVPYQGELIREN